LGRTVCQRSAIEALGAGADAAVELPLRRLIGLRLASTQQDAFVDCASVAANRNSMSVRWPHGMLLPQAPQARATSWFRPFERKYAALAPQQRPTSSVTCHQQTRSTKLCPPRIAAPCGVECWQRPTQSDIADLPSTTDFQPGQNG